MIHQALKKIQTDYTKEIKMNILHKKTRFYKNLIYKIGRIILIKIKVMLIKPLSMILNLIHLKCLNFLMVKQA